MSSGRSTRIAARPSDAANAAKSTGGRSCDASSFGSPSIARCSQVTWFRSRLSRTRTTRRGSFHSFQYFEIVTSSAMPFICMAPSPASATTTRSGKANLAAIAYGTADPIVARFPESEAIIPSRIRTSRAYQFADEPESAERMARSGRRRDSSQKTRCGFTGSAGFIARASSTFHQRRTSASIRSRQVVSSLGRRSGRSARSVSAESPTRFTSIG